MELSVNDRSPNFRATDGSGRLFLVRCFACGGERGRENWGPAVASGYCAWCGWKSEPMLTDVPKTGSGQEI